MEKEKKSRKLPIELKTEPDTTLEHQRSGIPKYVEEGRVKELWEAPSNIRDRKGKLHYQIRGDYQPNPDAGKPKTGSENAP